MNCKMDTSALKFLSLALCFGYLLGFESQHFTGKLQCESLSSTTDVIYPRIYKPRNNTQIYSTLRSKAHLNRIIITFKYNGQKHRLKLQKNKYSGRDLATSDCYYQGVRIRKDSRRDSVTLSTCNGLRGLVEIDGKGHVIEPRNVTDPQLKEAGCHPHSLRPLPISRNQSCGNQSGAFQAFEELHKEQINKYVEDMGKNLTSQASGRRTKRSTDPSYIRLAVVVDHAMMGQFEDSNQAEQFLLQIVNSVDSYYQQLNVRVGLIYREYWSEQDEINPTSNAEELLQNFLAYAQAMAGRDDADITHLISGAGLADSAGLAIPYSVCSERAVAVVSGSVDQRQRTASLLAHMIGHNLGLSHDADGCVCGHADGCLMSRNIGDSSPRDFSTCSIDQWKRLSRLSLGSCLQDPGSIQYPQFCGNGFLERGEQCDCGPVSTCSDPCCNAAICLLAAGAACIDGPCCRECQLKLTTEECRPAVGGCDVAEFCNAVGQCPRDQTIQDGEPCGEEEGYCWKGTCPLKDSQCQGFWGTNAESANSKCYNINNKFGSLFGHCGQTSHDDFTACTESNVECGLLQCESERAIPIESLRQQLQHRSATAGVSGNQLYHCKSVSATDGADILNVGMVADGTKCGAEKVCQGHSCQPLSTLITPSICPKGVNNLTCSGNGRCTTLSTCSCHRGYRGALCDEILPTSPSNRTNGSDSSSGSPGSLDTKWLVLIVVCVTLFFVVVTVLVVFFCRRKITTPKKLLSKKRKLASNASDVSSELDRDRVISFGTTPSYRADKAASPARGKKRRRRRRLSSSDEDSDSDSRSEIRDSRSGHSIVSPVQPKEVIIPTELTRQPERGILKNGGGKGLKLSNHPDEECSDSNCSCNLEASSCSCSDEECMGRRNHISVNVNVQGSVTIEFPPPAEFKSEPSTSNTPSEEISPPESENMKYCDTEADQFYKQYKPPNTHQYHVVADSATDSAIDMQPGEGSVSTINEIPPHYKSPHSINPSHNLHNSKQSSPMSQTLSETCDYHLHTTSLQTPKSKLDAMTPRHTNPKSSRDYINPRQYEAPNRGAPRVVYNNAPHPPGYLKQENKTPTTDQSKKVDAITV